MKTRFALGTFSRGDAPSFAGIVFEDRVVDLARFGQRLSITPAARIVDLLADWDRVLPGLLVLSAADLAEGESMPLTDLRIHPPVDSPRQIFCTGANYRQHVIDLTLDMGVGPEGLAGEELRAWAADMMDRRAAEGEPYVFTKPLSTLAGPDDDFVVPRTTKKADWEIELGVVIGRGGYRIPRERAMEHVAGYAVVNDITARDLIAREDYKMLGTDWLRAKGQPGFLPFGPFLVPAAFVERSDDLRLVLKVDGRTMQDETTGDMLFGVARQIEYISSFATLLPGDLICTGSPAGNGTHHGVFLQPGNVVEASIEGLGTQTMRCVADAG